MDLQIFENEKFGQVRIIEIEGKLHFVGIDVAKALGYKNANDAVTRHCKGYVKHAVPTNSGEQQMNVITEGDIYRLAAKSELPGAEKFESWVFDEVIPTVRKYGGYLTPLKVEEALLNPDTLILLATQLKEERLKRIQHESFINRIATSENSILVRELAKIASKDGFAIGERRLWDKLREWGLIFKNTTEPKQEYVDRGYFEVVEGARESSSGTFTYRTTKVTGKGQVYIVKRLLKEVGINETA